MALNPQYRPFTPLKHQHYKLATTQKELDAEARRQMMIDNNRFSNQASLANMQAQNQASIENARMKERAQARGLAQEQQQFNNQLDLRKQASDEQRLAQDLETQAYQRQQNAKTNQRLDQQFNLNQRVKEYALSQQQAEDARVRQERQRQQAERDKYMALAGIGSYLERQDLIRDKRMPAGDLVDFVKVLNPEFTPDGSEEILLDKENKVNFFNKNGPIMNNGVPYRIDLSVIDSSAPVGNMIKLQNLGLDPNKSDNRKELLRDYEHYRNQEEKAKEQMIKMQAQNPRPPEPPEGASEEVINQFEIEDKAYQEQAKRIKYFTDMKNATMALLGGNKQRLSDRVQDAPETTPDTATGKSKKEIVDAARAKAQSLSNKPVQQGLAQRDRSIGTNDPRARMIQEVNKLYPQFDASNLSDDELLKVLMENGITEINGQQIVSGNRGLSGRSRPMTNDVPRFNLMSVR